MTKFDSPIKSLFGIFLDSCTEYFSEMARPKTSSKKVSVTLPIGALTSLDQLVAGKFYGESRSEIARYLLIKALDVVEERRLKELGGD